MNRWTHSICTDCWSHEHPDQEPFVMKEEYREEEVCCYCGIKNRSGIYTRENPENLACHGGGPAHK
jgi:hypothetical protein